MQRLAWLLGVSVIGLGCGSKTTEVDAGICSTSPAVDIEAGTADAPSTTDSPWTTDAEPDDATDDAPGSSNPRPAFSDAARGCSDPPSLSHGSVTIPSTAIGAVARFACAMGYRLTGVETLTCRNDGSWSGAPPSCEVVDCGPPPVPENGTATATATTVGATATYRCALGHGPAGTSTRTCQVDGTWSGEVPMCVVADCPGLASPAHGTVNAPTLQYGSTAAYACEEGYTLTVSALRVCQTSGTWSGAEPACTLVDCGAPPAPALGTVEAAATTFGAVANYRCAEGAAATTPLTRTCGAAGVWSGATPVCSLISCGAPPPPSHGAVLAPSTTVGAAALYTCEAGYGLEGASVRTCQANGAWSDVAPSCAWRRLTVLTSASAGMGAVVPSGTFLAEEGVAIALRTVPVPGYRFREWTLSAGAATLVNATLPNATITLGVGDAGDASVLGHFEAIAPADALVGSYPFEGNANNAVAGASDGVVTGATLAPGLCRTSAYRFKWSTSDTISLANNAAMQFSSGMTVEAWVYPEAWDSTAAGYYRIISRYPSFLLRAVSGGYPVFAIDRSGAPGAYPSAFSSKALPLRAWSYVVGTFDGATIKLYVNGTLQATSNLDVADTLRDNANPIRIGDNALGEGFSGLIDNVGIFRRARSAAEIKETYDTIAACLGQ